MEDILVDKELEIKRKRPIFSQIAFYMSMLTVFMFLILVIAYLTKTTEIWETQLVWLTRIIFISIILGIGTSLVALLKKEKLKYLKLIGTVINFIFFVFFIAAAVSALIDLKKDFH